MKKKRFLVIGLGVLGNSLARTLAEEGSEVIAIDRSPQAVEQVKDLVDVAVVGDITDRKTLEQLGARDVDAAVMCVGESFESAVLATVHLLELKVKHVAARANSELAASILRRLGAHEVFFVEHAMGRVLAHKLGHSGITHELELGEGYKVVGVKAPKEMWGKALAELALPTRYNVQVIAVRSARTGEGGMRRPTAETVIEKDDGILISGHDSDISRFLAASPAG